MRQGHAYGVAQPAACGQTPGGHQAQHDRLHQSGTSEGVVDESPHSPLDGEVGMGDQSDIGGAVGTQRLPERGLAGRVGLRPSRDPP